MGCDYCVIGATARDLSLHYAHGIDIRRATEDVDISVMVRDWDAFTRLRAGLTGSGAFAERDEAVIHKLRHVGTKLPIDGAQLLAAQSGLAIPQAVRLIQALSTGLSESSQTKAP